MEKEGNGASQQKQLLAERNCGAAGTFQCTGIDTRGGQRGAVIRLSTRVSDAKVRAAQQVAKGLAQCQDVRPLGASAMFVTFAGLTKHTEITKVALLFCNRYAAWLEAHPTGELPAPPAHNERKPRHKASNS